MKLTLSSVLLASTAVGSCMAAAVEPRAPEVTEHKILRAIVRRQDGAADTVKPVTRIRLGYSASASAPAQSKAQAGQALDAVAEADADADAEPSSTLPPIDPAPTTSAPGTPAATTVPEVDPDADAVVDGTTRLPAVVLENIASVSGVTCSEDGTKITIPFGNAGDFADAKVDWPQKDFIIITTSEGGCAEAGQRGFYEVSAVSFDVEGAISKVATVTSKRSTLVESMNDVNLDWNTRGENVAALNIPVSFDASGKTLVSLDPLTLTADVATVKGEVRVRGALKYNVNSKRLERLTVDVEVDSEMALNLTAKLSGAQATTKSFDVTPFDQAVAAFSIPGVLTVGPMVSLGLGVEAAASGAVSATTGAKVVFSNSSVHINLLELSSSSTNGWAPGTSLETKLEGDVSMQVNPYAAVSVGVGIKALADLVDLSASIKARPQLINSFNLHAEATAAYTSETGVTFTAPDNVAGQCPNGAWFGSTLHLGVTASVGTSTKDLFVRDYPLYKSQCYSVVNPPIAVSRDLSKRTATAMRV